MIRRILIPLDGSELAESTLPFVRIVGRGFSPSVLLLRVVDRGGEGPEGLGSVDWRLERAEAEAYLESVARDLREDGLDEIGRRVAVGNAAVEILDAARDWEADLIAVSTHGEGGVTSFGMSGTAQKVVFNAPASIFLARPTVGSGHGEGPADAVLERIVVPVDGSPRGDWALCLAASLARASGAELVAVRVLPSPELIPGPRRPSPAADDAVRALKKANREAAESHLRRMADKLKAPNLELRTRIVSGDSVPRTLERVCAEEGASLLVLSAHGGSSGGRWRFGSVTDALLTHGSTPTLVFQDESRIPGRQGPFRVRRSMSDHPRRAWSA